MTNNGRLERGKENYEKKRFLDNSETVDYIKTLKPVNKDVEAKNAKSDK